MQIVCNYHLRDVLSGFELPASAREQFDYLDWSDPDNEDTAFRQFVQYRGEWYDLSDVPMAPDSIRAKGFDGFISDSFWSGIAFRYFDSEGYEYDSQVIVASVYFEGQAG